LTSVTDANKKRDEKSLQYCLQVSAELSYTANTKTMVISKCIKYLRRRFGNGWRSSWAQSVIGILCSFTGAKSSENDLSTVTWL